MRILHVIDPQSADGRSCTLKLLSSVTARLSDCEHRVMILGDGRHIQQAHECDVPVSGCIPLPRSLPWAGRNSLQRFVKQLKSAGQDFDLMHAWTLQSAAACALASPRTACLATLHVGPQNGLAARYARRVLYRNPIPLLAATSSVRREHRNSGIHSQWIALFPPAVDITVEKAAIRQQLRSKWSAAHQAPIGDGTHIIGLLCEPCELGDVWHAVNVAARVALTGRPVRLLVHSEATRRVESLRLLQKLRLENLLLLDDDIARPWQLACALDSALFVCSSRTHSSGSVLPLLHAMRAALPVVAEHHESARELIEDGRSGFLAPPQDASAAAERILRLCDDQTLARNIGQSARDYIADMYNIEEYCLRLKHAYELRLANRSVRTFSDADSAAHANFESVLAG